MVGSIPSIMVSVEQFSSFRHTAPAKNSPILPADCSEHREKLQIRGCKLLLLNQYLLIIKV